MDGETRALLERIVGTVDHLQGKLERVEAKLDRFEGKVDRLTDDMQDVKMRMHTVEAVFAAAMPSVLGQGQRSDKLDARVSLIAKRLDIREAGA